MNFLTIQDGDYTINLNLVSEIEWNDDSAEVTMVTGTGYTVEGADLDELKERLGLAKETRKAA